jgi:hypothetical protein
MKTPTVAPGVARLRRDEGRRRGEKPARAFLAVPTAPFLSPEQERELFVDLKRRGVVRPKAGFGDVEPFLTAYKQAVREAQSGGGAT